MAAEAVLCVGAAGSGAPRKGDYRLPGAAEETGAKGGKTASAAWAGTAQRSERRTDVDAGDDGLREQALTFELGYDATTLMRGVNRRSLWRMERQRNPTMSAPAAGTAALWLPGRLCGVFAEDGPQRCGTHARTARRAKMTQGLKE